MLTVPAFRLSKSVGLAAVLSVVCVLRCESFAFGGRRSRQPLVSSASAQYGFLRNNRKACVRSAGDEGDPAAATAANAEESTLQRLLTGFFQGDFDNYNQVLQDRSNGMQPREGGGHEHIHCTLVPVSPTSRLAAFYFDGQPEKIFRFRYYRLNDTQSSTVDMQIYTICPELLRLLRDESPSRWRKVFVDYQQSHPDSSDTLTILERCDVRWSTQRDPTEHTYLDDFDGCSDSEGIHAVMIYGEAVVDSQMSPGQKIRIVDQLSLFEDVFYINDRGFDPESGDFIYGNQRGVPYRLKRVATWENANDSNDNYSSATMDRTVVNKSLAWTLGKAMRSDAEYRAKLDAIGGTSRRKT